jgi:protein-disulfide isomerase
VWDQTRLIFRGNMRRRRLLDVFAVALAAGLLLLPLRAESEPLPKDRAELDAYLREYIMSHPDVVRDALLKLDQSEQAENTKKVLGSFKEQLYRAGSPEIGSTNAKVKIVEFYDYNCPYCRSAYTKLSAYLKANPDTALVLKDVASFGPDSEAVARIAIAAKQQGKFEALNDALMTMKGKATEARALELAEKLGLDTAKLKADAKSQVVSDQIAANRTLADRLNVTTTPLMIIGHNGISGAPDDLESQLGNYGAEVRKAGCDVC